MYLLIIIGTRQNAEILCRSDRHGSDLITWLIRIMSLYPAVCVQQSETLTLT